MQVQLLNGVTATNGPPVAVKATASITTVVAANIVEGETFALQGADGGCTVFVFTKTAGVYVDRGYGAPRHPVSLVGAVTADDVRDRIITAVNDDSATLIVASSGGAATVTLTQGRFGTAGNTATAEQVVNAGFVITNFAGGLFSGVDIQMLRADRDLGTAADKMSLILRSTAGSGVMTVTGKLWGFNTVAGAWSPLGSAATDVNRGVINLATAIGELAAPADQLNYADTFDGLFAMDRAYLEVVAIGGAATAVSAWIVRP